MTSFEEFLEIFDRERRYAMLPTKRFYWLPGEQEQASMIAAWRIWKNEPQLWENANPDDVKNKITRRFKQLIYNIGMYDGTLPMTPVSKKQQRRRLTLREFAVFVLDSPIPSTNVEDNMPFEVEVRYYGSVDDYTIKVDSDGWVKWCLSHLNKNQQECVIYRDINCLPYEIISRITGRSESAIANARSRALNKLKIIVGEEVADSGRRRKAKRRVYHLHGVII